MKPTLNDASNTFVPAYLALVQRGLSVRHEPLTPDDKVNWWIAESATSRFVAEDLVIQLGLVALYETRGPDWEASDEQIDQFLADFGDA